MKSALHLSAALCGSLLLLTSTAPAQSILRSSGDFALLAATAITGTATAGTEIRNGDVGLWPTAATAITGFPPALIIGGSLILTSPQTEQAQLDLHLASAGLAAMSFNTDLTGLDLGGRTLLPGVYRFDAAAAQSGPLILDAQGQNNAYWVFQIGTTLTTAAASSVSFINLGSNGGADDGLFWNIGSAASIGATNTLAGNYIVGTSMTIGNLSGGANRILAKTGAISLDVNFINATDGPGISLSGLTGGLMFDTGGLIVPIPEPATTVLLSAIAILALAVCQRRTKSKQ
jgi:hypothetical protein